MKKITAILLAVMLILSLSITAYAEETTNGTITVNGAENGQTYTLYKIFDISEVNGSNAYFIPSGKDYSSETFSSLFETNTDTSGETEVTYVTRKTGVQDSAIINWAKDNTASFGTAVTTEAAADAKVEFTGLARGYYYVASPVSNGATAMIADTTQTATVVEKNSTPGWGEDPEDETPGGKTADGETYYAGQTITYTLTYYNAVNYDQGKQVTKYIIEDTLPAGITYGGDVSATVNDTAVTLTTEENVSNGFKVSIPWTNTDEEGNVTSKYTTNPSKIVVTYTATMGNTKIAEGITNTAKIYPDTNTNPGDETEKEDTVYTGQIVLTKVDNSDNTKVLSGAKFKVKVGANYLKETNGNYSEVSEAEATVFVTGEDGKITLKGLKEGTYTFVETEAPAGYNLPENPEVATVVLELTEGENGAVVTTSMSKTQQVNNSKAAAMPETGGMGTTMFYLVGSFLAVSAVILLITKKRMQADC